MRIICTISITALLLLLPALVAAQEEDPIAQARRLTRFGVDAAMKQLWSEASFRWRQAIQIYPNFPAAHNNLAVVLEHLGEYEQAKEHYATASQLSRNNRYVNSNARMFSQFYYQLIKEREKQTRQDRGEGGDSTGEKETSPGETDPGRETGMPEGPEGEGGSAGAPAVTVKPYRKVGSPQQVLIKHPKRQTQISENYRRVYIAGFSPMKDDADNLNFETTEYLRSELRKFSLYEIIPLEELSLPQDEDEFYDLVDDEEFWQRLGNKVGADLIVYGRVSFYSEPSDGFYPYEYRDYRTGNYRTAQLLIQRTAFTIELDLFFHEAATGKLIHEDSFGQTIVYRGRLDLTLQAFFDVMNRILPRFMDTMVPREHDAIRFLLRG